jgi:uncharacterized membrane protein
MSEEVEQPQENKRTHIHIPANLGERVADAIASFIGSWRFIIGQAILMFLWVIVNTLAFFHVLHFDSYPFVFLNLAMSAEAAFSAPIIMMSQNRSAVRDKKRDDLEASEVQDLYDINKTQLQILNQQSEILELLKDKTPRKSGGVK